MAGEVKKIPIIADMHTHINEKNVDPKEWWGEVKKKKLSVVCITEHAEYDPKSGYEKLLVVKPKDIVLVPGLEAKTSAGHLLIFGKDASIYDSKILLKLNAPVEEVLAEAKERGFTASFSHPYGYKTDSVCLAIGEQKTKALLKKYGAGAEYYNGMLGSANSLIFGTQWIRKLYNFFDFLEKNKLAKKLLLDKKSGKVKLKFEKISTETFERVRQGMLFGENAPFITVGSDAHHAKTIGTAIIELKRKPKNAEEFLGMIRRREFVWAGPNRYMKNPIDKLKKKELLEGLKYMTKKKIQRKIKKP